MKKSETIALQNGIFKLKSFPNHEAYAEDSIFTLQPLDNLYAKVRVADAHKFDSFESFTNTMRLGVHNESRLISALLLDGKPIAQVTDEELARVKSKDQMVYPLNMWNLANYREDGTTAGTNIINTGAVLIDIDDTDKSVDYIVQVLNLLKTDWMLVSSLRHKENRTKVHIILPVSQPITEAVVYKRTWWKLNEYFKHFGINIDTQVSDWTRRMYLASSDLCRRNVETGHGLVPVLEKTQKEIERDKRMEEAAKNAGKLKLAKLDLEKAAIYVATAKEGNRNGTLNRILWMLKQRGATVEELRAVASVSNVETKEELRSTFRSATGFEF